MRFVASALAIVLALSACKGADDAGAGGATGGGEGDANAAWIIGEWDGIFKSKTADQSSELRETSATATFASDGSGEYQGTFRIELPLLENVHVEGTFIDFAKKSLRLDIKTSTLSAIGLQGSRTELNYELIGNALELSSERLLLRLLRGKNPGGSTGGGTGNGNGTGTDTTPHRSVGRYSCSDNQGRDWMVVVKSDGTFSVYVETLWLDGTVRTDAANYDAVLAIERSNDDDVIGQELRLKLFGDLDMTLTRTSKDGDNLVEGERLSCRRSD